MDQLPEPVRDFLGTAPGVAVLVLALGVVVFVMAHFSGRVWFTMFGTPPPAKEDALRENLGEYPPPPGSPGPRRLTIDGVAVRVRLVVVAPVVKGRDFDKENVGDTLDKVVKGLKEIVQRDKPRIRFWPHQLSATGFAPTFFRLTETPGEEGMPSPWVHVAGPANAAGLPIVLGLGCLADEPNELGLVTLTPETWQESVHVASQQG